MNRPRLTVKRKYILSYLLIVLAVTVLFSTITITISANEMRDTLVSEHMNRLRLAAADLGTQVKSVETVMANIKVSRTYQPVYLRKSLIHELELIDDFQHFRSYFPFAAEQYLLYRDTNTAYFQSSKCSWETLCSLYFQIEGDATLNEAALLAQGPRMLRRETEMGDLLWFMPFQLGYGENRQNVCLLLVMRERALKDRLASVSGLKPEDFALRLDTAIPGTARSVAVPNTLYELAIDSTASDALVRLDMLLRLEYAVCGAILVICCVIAVFIAIRQYKPIGTLTEYVGADPQQGGEFRHITAFIDSTVTENEQVKLEISDKLESIVRQSRIINQQTVTMRRQLILLMMLGMYRVESERMPEVLVGQFPFRRFAVAYALLGEAAGTDDALAERVEAAARGDGCAAHAVPLRNDAAIAVLLNLDRAEGAEEAARAIANALGDEVRVCLGDVFDGIAGVAASYAQALNRAYTATPRDMLRLQEDAGYRELYVGVMAGDLAMAREGARRYVASFQLEGQSVFQRRRVFMTAAEQLRGLSEKAGTEVPEDAYLGMLLSLHSGAFEGYLDQYVVALCSPERRGEAGQTQVRAMDVLAYIDEHACESDMSMIRLEDHFKISSKTLSTTVKRVTNLGFREYIIYRRIEHAKLMLLNTQLTIATIAEMSGYENVSYFIKSFKNITGKTPGQFQRDGM